MLTDIRSMETAPDTLPLDEWNAIWLGRYAIGLWVARILNVLVCWVERAFCKRLAKKFYSLVDCRYCYPFNQFSHEVKTGDLLLSVGENNV